MPYSHPWFSGCLLSPCAHTLLGRWKGAHLAFVLDCVWHGCALLCMHGVGFFWLKG